MFHENENLDQEIVGLIQSNDVDSLMNYWHQSTELQEEIAKQIFMLSDKDSAIKMFDFLKSRLKNPSKEEKLNIVTAFEDMGGQMPEVELSTTEQLCGMSDEDTDVYAKIIKARHGKLMGVTIDNPLEKEDSQFCLNLIHKLGESQLKILHGDNPNELKYEAVAGLWRTKYDETIKDGVVSTLSAFLDSPDPKMKMMSLGELAFMISPDDPKIIKTLKEIIFGQEISNLSRHDLQSLAIISSRTKEKDFMPFLDSLSKNPDYQEVYSFQSVIKEAKDDLIKLIHERQKDEN